MSFIDTDNLPATKTSFKARPEVPANRKFTALDFNLLKVALQDLRAWVRSGVWQGLVSSDADPEPSGVSEYLWIDSSGVLQMKFGGVNVPVSGAVSDGFGLIGAGTSGDKLRINGRVTGFVTARSYGVLADGTTDDRSHLIDAANGALSLGARLHLGEGVIRVGRDSTNPWNLDFTNKVGLFIHGVKGKTKIRALASATNVATPTVRFNKCRHGGLYDVDIDGFWGNYASEITWESDGQDLSAGPFTLHVKTTEGAASAGTIKAVVGTSLVDIVYTGKTDDTFTGCTSTSGILRSGNCVGYLDDNTGINHTTQADPRSHGVMLRGCEDFELSNVGIYDTYGDAVWIGFTGDPIEDGTEACRNIRLRGVTASMTARHGLSVSQAAERISIRDCEFNYVFGFSVDCEAQGTGQFIRDLGIDGGFFGVWWNPTSAGRQQFGVSIKGAGVFGLVDGDIAKSCYVRNAKVLGSIAAWACRGLLIENNHLEIDWDHSVTNGSFANVFVDHCDHAVEIVGNNIYTRGSIGVGSPDGDPAHSAIVVQSYGTSLRPGGARVANNHIRAVNARGGIKVSGAGGRLNGTQEFTASATTSLSVTVPGAGWTTDEHVGKTIYLGGKVAAVAGNSATVLTHTGWFRPSGNGGVQATPAAGAFKLRYPSGVVTVEGNEIDLTDDGNGAGGYGISAYSKLSGCTYRIRHNNVKNATGHAYHLDLSASTPNPLLEVVGNYAYDDQQTQTTDVGFWFNGMEFVDHKVIYGNYSPGIPTHLTGLEGESWQTSNSFPSSWAGYEDPNGAVDAPASSTYHRLDTKEFYIKQSPDGSSSGWQAALTNPRSSIVGVGVPASGAANVTPGLPSASRGQVLVCLATNHDPAVETTITGNGTTWTRKIHLDTSALFHNRGSIFYARYTPGMNPPTVNNPAGINGAIIFSVRDCVPYGDPFQDAQSLANTDMDGDIVFPDATSTEADSLIVQCSAAFCGGGGATPGSISGWTNANLTEIEEFIDSRLAVGSDVFNFNAISARQASPGAIGAQTHATMTDAYNIVSAFTLVFKPAQLPGRAYGSINFTAKANYVDGETQTVPDGINPPKIYEFDTNGSVTSGNVRVDISGATTAAQVAAVFRTAMLANQPSLIPVDNGDGTLSITHGWAGSNGNISMSDTVAHAGHTTSGFVGGAG